jgi:hypothetical protein
MCAFAAAYFLGMAIGELPPSARFIGHVNDFIALQAHFRRRFNLSSSQWLTLYGALVSVRYEHGHWICSEFSTADIVKTSLTSRETVRRSINRLLSKGLVNRNKRRYIVSPVTFGELRGMLDDATAMRARAALVLRHNSSPHVVAISEDA